MAVYYVKRWSIVILFIVMVASPPLIMAECSSYSSIFSFGDSKADTGNLFFGNQYPSHHCLSPPNGQTYFHHTSGRCSDGRLIIDFIAESLGIPMVKPYLGIKKGVLEDSAVKDGVNFAVIAATALDISFFEERDIHYFVTNYSLNVQMNWFKELLSAVCNNSKKFVYEERNTLRKYLGSANFEMRNLPKELGDEKKLLKTVFEEVKKFSSSAAL